MLLEISDRLPSALSLRPACGWLEAYIVIRQFFEWYKGASKQQEEATFSKALYKLQKVDHRKDSAHLGNEGLRMWDGRNGKEDLSLR